MADTPEMEQNTPPKRSLIKGALAVGLGAGAAWVGGFAAIVYAALERLPPVIQRMSRDKNIPGEFLIGNKAHTQELTERLSRDLARRYPNMPNAVRVAPFVGGAAGLALYLHATKPKPQSWQERVEEPETEQACAACGRE